MSGEGSSPADRQAAIWWSHLATQSQPEMMGHLRVPFLSQRILGVLPASGLHRGERFTPKVTSSGAEAHSLSLFCSQCAYCTAAVLPLSVSSSRGGPFTPHPPLRMWRGTSPPGRWPRPSTSRWLPTWCRSSPRLPPAARAPACPAS